MSTIAQLMTEARRVTGSDLATAEKLGFHQSSVSKVRSGTLHLAPYHAARMAEIAGHRWWEGLLQTLVERSDTPTEAAYWRDRFEALRKRYAWRAAGTGGRPKSHPETVDGAGP